MWWLIPSGLAAYWFCAALTRFVIHVLKPDEEAEAVIASTLLWPITWAVAFVVFVFVGLGGFWRWSLRIK